MSAWATAEQESPGRNLMLAHDRHDVAELNRLAREWREAWGRLSDRRIVDGGTDWAIGDRLMCRRNDYSLDVRNGTAGKVVWLDPLGEHLDLFTDHGAIVRLPADYLAHARHGYALTGHVSQGESVDRTFVLASPERGGAEWAYVAGSRHRHDLHVSVTHHESEDVEEALARAWSRSQAKSLALDLADRAVRDGMIAAVRADLDAATPELLLARAGELRAAREAARQTAASVPSHQRARVAELRGALARAAQGAKDAESRAGRLGDRLNRIRVWRWRERAEVRSTIERARRDLQRHKADGNAARGELAGLGPALARAADVEGARSQARGLGGELDAVQKRLEGWRAPDLGGRGRPTPGHERAQPPIDRDLGRGR